ncbi:hypothetical protein HYT33_00425 [Candidatus Roizmanbacteria bacterium]|nr:hypothetical protein [Candidatus Roizmanbacteria bacterium]
MRKLLGSLLVVFSFLTLISSANAGWVNGYFRRDGTYVPGYWRTEPNYYKWDNYSFNNDWSDIYNDRSWYRDFGYDPEPLDDEDPNYGYWSYPRNNYSDYDWWDY